MRRASPLLYVAIGACGAPPSPQPPELRPEPPSANDCDPTPRVAHAPFHFADLQAGRSCRVFLEQDECVVAIFDDCTDPTRHFEGRATAEGGIWLSPEHTVAPTATPPSRCEGIVADRDTPHASVRLDCRGAGLTRHRGFFLERVDPSATPPLAFESSVELPGDIVGLASEGRVLVAGGSSGLYDAAGELRVAAASPVAIAEGTGSTLVVATQTELLVVDWDARQVVRSKSLSGEVIGLTLNVEGTEILVGVAAGTASSVRRFAVSDLNQLGTALELPARLAAIAPVPLGGEHRFAVLIPRDAGAFGTASELWLLDGSMAPKKTVEVDVEGASVSPLTNDRIAVFAKGRNLYLEVDLLGVESVAPVPYLDRATSYAANAARAIVAGSDEVGPVVALVDVSVLRAKHGVSRLTSSEVRYIKDDGDVVWLAAGRELVKAVASNP